jgi:membrane protein DedA with SNARE-associated domain
MFDWLVATFSSHPYAGCALLFLLCGLGLPLPEEIVLLFAGYVCFEGLADREAMMAVCCGAILLGDVIPFFLGRRYGPRLLRIRLLRILITPQRLARFDRWFRRRGELVVFFSRFIAGIRVVCYFTAGTMRMAWLKFLALDLAGILLIGPLLVWVGHHYGGTIRAAIARMQKIARRRPGRRPRLPARGVQVAGDLRRGRVFLHAAVLRRPRDAVPRHQDGDRVPARRHRLGRRRLLRHALRDARGRAHDAGREDEPRRRARHRLQVGLGDGHDGRRPRPAGITC